jgi:molecular chaperone GrpE
MTKSHKSAKTTNPEPLGPAQDAPAVEPVVVADDWQPGEAVPAAEAASAIAALDDRYLRLAAEYENYRKRTHREKTEAFDRGATSLVSRLLDVLDDVDRLAASDAATSPEAFRSAFDLTQKKLRKELEAAGLERVDPVGEVFNPEEQEAVAVATPESPEQDHTVKATFQTGYRFKGMIVRPARVQVYTDPGAA